MNTEPDAIEKKFLELEFYNYVSALANKTDLSRCTIHKFFRGKKVGYSNRGKIYEAALVLLSEAQDKKIANEHLLQKLGLAPAISKDKVDAKNNLK
jgi:hypothetical protein